MLDIWQHMTELSFRGFGKNKRKFPREPKNFNTWSAQSQDNWYKTQEEKLAQQELWDMNFIATETRIVDAVCREIVYLIDRANTMNPQYLCECDEQRKMQDKAIGLCNNLKRELNHIAATIPSNANYLAVQTELIEKEIAILRGWRKSCNPIRKNVIIKEIERRVRIADKLGFVIGTEDIQKSLDELIRKSELVTN